MRDQGTRQAHQSGRAHGKTAALAFDLKHRLARGERVVVRTPAGSVDAERWLANRGFADHPDEFPAARIVRGDG